MLRYLLFLCDTTWVVQKTNLLTPLIFYASDDNASIIPAPYPLDGKCETSWQLAAMHNGREFAGLLVETRVDVEAMVGLLGQYHYTIILLVALIILNRGKDENRWERCLELLYNYAQSSQNVFKLFTD